jgi:DNA-binding CsgD family transcriptional regulator
MRVLETNAVAETLLAKNDGLTCREGSLAAREETNALQAAVAAACRPDPRHPIATTLIVNRGHGRRPLVLQIIPLSGKDSSAMFAALLPANAAIFIVDPETSQGGALDLFCGIYKLTAAERQVLERLSAASSPSEIARSLGIGVATVRTHLHRLFDKTGTRRPPELLVLLNNFTPPIQ